MRYAILKRGTDDRPSAALTLRDARSAQLFLEDRVCDVLRNRARVSASARRRAASTPTERRKGKESYRCVRFACAETVYWRTRLPRYSRSARD